MLAIAIQAGGRSTRMGQDKASLPFLGKPLIARLKDRFQGCGLELLAICIDLSPYQDLGLDLYLDLVPHRGALGGLYTALFYASQPLVGIIAVDLPFASPDLMQALASILDRGGADGVIPSSQQGIEPLHGVYRRETCLPLVKGALDAQQWKIRSWFDQARIQILDPDETRQLGALDHTFINLNTLEDLRAAEDLALQLGET